MSDALILAVGAGLGVALTAALVAAVSWWAWRGLERWIVQIVGGMVKDTLANWAAEGRPNPFTQQDNAEAVLFWFVKQREEMDANIARWKHVVENDGRPDDSPTKWKASK